MDAVDSMSSQELLDAADALIVSLLGRNAASAAGNLLCGRVYERLADVEAREIAAAKAAKAALGEPITEDDDHAGSGWTVEARLDAAHKSFLYVSSAYKDAEYAGAPLGLARLAKRAGKLEEAAQHLKTALERDASLAEAADLLQRVQRLQAGQPEFPAPEKRSKASRGGAGGKDDVAFEGIAADFVVDANMTPEERKAAYFAHLKAEKKRKEDEEKAKEAAKLSSMTPEERAEYEAAKAAKAKHEERKDKVLNKTLGQYGGSGRGAAIAAGRGRGRGRGRGK